MVIINGKTYYGNVNIVNGRVVGEDSDDNCHPQKIDKRKTENCNGIKKINIRSNSTVRVCAESERKDIVAHLHGYVEGNAEPKLSVTRKGDELSITVESSSSNGNGSISTISMGSVVINTSGSNGNLILEVMIPSYTFEEIAIDSKNANIDVTDTVNAESINIDSKNGNVDVSATFQHLSINNKNGNIDVDSTARSDVKLDITSKNGNIDVSVDNIGNSKVFVENKNGICKNRPRLKGKYTAYGSIISKNGNLRFK